MISLLQRVFPDRPIRTRILRGPFRGAIIVMNPRNSLRKVFGLYEHELNSWIEEVLPRVARVLDVGANDGYFTFGCAAAFRRLGKTGEIVAFEPEKEHLDALQEAVAMQPNRAVRIELVQALVGNEVKSGVTTLDAVCWEDGDSRNIRSQTLIKIDVEGAELDVLDGASQWLNSTNYFVIEVHQEGFLEPIIALFRSRGLHLRRVDQRPLPLLGPEMRSQKNWWLVSDLEAIR